MTTRRLWACAGAAAVLAGVPAAAQLDWVGTTGTLFYDTATNWSPAQTPNTDVPVTFAVNTASNPIIVGASSGAAEMSFLNFDWLFTGAAGGTLNGGGVLINDASGTSFNNGTNVIASDSLTWENGGDAIIGDTGFGTLTVTGASVFSARQFLIGNTATGRGEMNLIGAGTRVEAYLNVNTGVFSIGKAGGQGTVNVLAGAQLRTTSTSGNDIWVGGHTGDTAINPAVSSTGTLNVDGAGSFAETEDLQVGLAGGTGFLNITNGGQVINTDGGTNGSPDTAFANGAGSTGIGLIDGDNSLLRSRRIDVGLDGLGTLAVSAGGVARTQRQGTSIGDVFIGSNAGSNGKVAVYGNATDGVTRSLLDIDDNLYVGSSGLGQLNIGRDLNDGENGVGALEVDGVLIIGNDAGNTANNKVVVSGGSATINTGGYLRVGVSGNGSFEARDGATVQVATDFSAAAGPGGTGSILVDGPGTTVTASSTFIGNGNSGPLATGTMLVSNQAVVTFTSPTNGVVTLGDEENGNGTITVLGTGSLVQSTGGTAEWWVGGSSNDAGGTGTLNILSGGQVNASGRAVFGYGAQATGTLNVTGAGSVFNANGDYILLGFNGVGSGLVSNGGVVNADNMFIADGNGPGASTLTIDGAGSTVNLQGLLNVGDTGVGVLNVINGGQLNVALGGAADRLIIGDEGSSDGSRLTVSGVGSRVDYFSPSDIAVGNAGGSTTNRAVLEVLGGAVFSAVQRNPDQSIANDARIIIGDVDGGNGRVRVDGAGSRLEAETIFVGDGNTNATGLLEITGGGVVELTNEFQAGSNGSGNGVATVSGAGSQLLIAGALSLGDDVPTDGPASGTLNITDGGYVSNDGQAYIGHFTGSFGTATLDSSTANNAVWDIGGELTLAGTETSSQGSGFGVLNVNTGGVVNIASNLRVRNLGDLNLSGGTVNIGGDLILTDAGSTINFAFGTLRFNDTGVVTLSPTELERILQLGGGNRPTLFTNMHLAVAGTANFGGPLRINGGTLSVGAFTPGSLIQLDFDAGTLNLTASDLTIGSGGALGVDVVIDADQALNVTQKVTVTSSGSLTVVGNFSAGSLSNNGDLTFIDAQPGAKQVNTSIVNQSVGKVTVVGDVQFNGGVNGVDRFYGPGRAIFGGLYEIGGSPKQVRFDGSMGVAPSGSLEIELGGLTPGAQHDQLIVLGDAQLGGALELKLLGNYVPSLGDTFTILTSAALNGTTFDSLISPTFAGNLGFGVSYTATDVVVTVITALPGDTDGDGDIDDADLGTSFANYTGPVGAAGGKNASLGDTDGDGDVDDGDLGATFAGYTGPLSPGSVPEPASLVILAGLMGLASRRRR